MNPTRCGSSVSLFLALMVVSVEFLMFINPVGAELHFVKVGYLQLPTLTSFGVAINGSVFSVTAAHIGCFNSSPRNSVACDGIDIALMLECPESGFALDGTDYDTAITGDTAYIKGFYDDRAIIGDNYGRSIKNPPYSSLPIVNPNYKYLIGNPVSLGLSGSCVANNNGIVGVAVSEDASDAVMGSQQRTSYLLVPWHDVLTCVSQKQETHEFPTLTACNTDMVYLSNLNAVERFIVKVFHHPWLKGFAEKVYQYVL